MTQVLKKGLWRFAALYDREANEAWMPIWTEALKECEPGRVARGLLAIEKTFIPSLACPFPTPAHILNILRDEDSSARAAEAEIAWQATLKTIHDFFHPQIGWKKWAPQPPLAPRSESAARTAGGLEAIYLAPDDRLVWIKKEFLKAYMLSEETPSPESLPVHPDVAKLAGEKT